MSPQFDFVFNSSLEQYVEPLEDWEYVSGGTHVVIFFSAVYIVHRIWQGETPKHDMTKKCLQLFSVVLLLSLPPSIFSNFQITTPDPTTHYLCEFVYALTLSANYLVLFARQEAMFSSGMSLMLSETHLEQRENFVILFKLSFVVYFVACLLLPFIPTIYIVVVAQDATSQGLRVVFYHPLWVRVFLALGDSTISAICLMLYLLPVIEFQKATVRIALVESMNNSVEQYSNRAFQIDPISKKLQLIAYKNLKWTVISTLATFLFFTTAHTLQWRYNSVWTTMGGLDVLVKVLAISKIAVPESNKIISSRKNRSRRTSPEIDHQDAFHHDSLTLNPEESGFF